MAVKDFSVSKCFEVGGDVESVGKLERQRVFGFFDPLSASKAGESNLPRNMKYVLLCDAGACTVAHIKSRDMLNSTPQMLLVLLFKKDAVI